MARKISEFEIIKLKKRRKQVSKKIFLFSMFMFVFVLCWHFRNNIAYISDMVSINYNSFKNNTQYPKSILGEQPIGLQKFNNNVMLICENSMSICGVHQAAQIFNINRNFSNGGIRHNNKRIATFDYATGNLNLYDRFKNVYNEQGKCKIYNVKIANNNYVAILSDSLHYASCARILDANNKQIFSWNCTDGYVINGAFSSDSKKVAIVSLKSSEGKIQSTISIFDIKSGKLNNRISVSDLIFDIIYSTSEKIIAITRNSVYFFNRDIQHFTTYNFENEELLKFNWSDNIIALCFKKYLNGASSKIVTLNLTGDLLGENELKGEVKSLKAEGNSVGVLAEDRIFLFDKDMKLKKSYKCNVPVYDFLQIGNSMFLVTADEINKVRM